MAQVNIQQLFEDKQEQLALSWVAGANGAAKILDMRIRLDHEIQLES